MIQTKTRFSPNFDARNRRNLLGGGFGLFSATLLISWGCGEAAPYPGTQATGGTPAATGGAPAATGGTAATTGGTAAATGGTPATGGAAAIPTCVTTVLTAKCVICHSPTGAPAFGGLDLVGDFLPRLLDKPATNIGVANPGSCMPGAKLIDSAAPESSVLLKRLIGPPDCGTMMPSGAMLTSEEKTCFQTWVQTF